MSTDRFILSEFTSDYNESTKMFDNQVVYYGMGRDDDPHLSFNFTSYNEVIAPPPELTFVHKKKPYVHPKPQMRFPRR